MEIRTDSCLNIASATSFNVLPQVWDDEKERVALGDEVQVAVALHGLLEEPAPVQSGQRRETEVRSTHLHSASSFDLSFPPSLHLFSSW